MTITEAFEQSENLQSKIPAEYISRLNGLSSPKIWHLLNNLAAQSDNYLEIGTHMGSTLMAALYGNDVNATAVDNFCMKPQNRNHFFQNVKNLKFNFIEKDCFTIQEKELPPIDLYFYDGEHSYNSQYKAIKHFIGSMTQEFIYVCDDWNNSPVREGTLQAIMDCKLEIVEYHERRHKTMKDKENWWCGIAVFKLKKV
jgi:hypothetical protein